MVRKQYLLIVFCFTSWFALHAQIVEIVKDFGVEGQTTFPQEATVVNDKFFFSYKTPAEGSELWISDGTSAGTHLVKDINPGSADAHVVSLSAIGNILYFTATDGIHGLELWRSDGTADGTTMVKDINPGSADGMNASFIGQYKAQVAMNGVLYFRATNGIEGVELWKSDGTLAGTTSVIDIVVGPDSSNPFSFLINNGTIYFVADNYLFKTNGTKEGTVRLASSAYPVFLSGIGTALGKLFFQAQHIGGSYQMCVSDGTPEGTKLFKIIYPGGFGRVSDFNEINNNAMIFIAENELGRELWVSDNTAEGTMLLKDIKPGAEGGIPYNSDLIRLKDSTYLFTANDGVSGNELWKTDGTMEGTVLIKDIEPGVDGSIISDKILFQNKIYFFGSNNLYGNELWVSDGSEAGTHLVNEFVPGVGYGGLSVQLEFQQHVYFFSLQDSMNMWRYGPSATVTAVEPIQIRESRRFSFPNPSEGKINLIEEARSVILINICGGEETFNNTMQLQTNMRGVCVLKIITKKGECVIEKVIIE